MSSFWSAPSTDSEMAMPRLPLEFGFSAKIAFPDWVVSEGDAIQLAPKDSIIALR
ncbi:uncharacterized protein METZ01_LOCUS232126 [marine metagenome]|uniref:Uncharacterized protein n=1 Tax=marine metagenome TaxID=408172 RepID=A0A382GWM3_9ZZZZ